MFSKLVTAIAILTGDLMCRETLAHTAVAWLAPIRFIEEWVVGIHAMDNEKCRNINIAGSDVITQAFD